MHQIMNQLRNKVQTLQNNLINAQNDIDRLNEINDIKLILYQYFF